MKIEIMNYVFKCDNCEAEITNSTTGIHSYKINGEIFDFCLNCSLHIKEIIGFLNEKLNLRIIIEKYRRIGVEENKDG